MSSSHLPKERRGYLSNDTTNISLLQYLSVGQSVLPSDVKGVVEACEYELAELALMSSVLNPRFCVIQ